MDPSLPRAPFPAPPPFWKHFTTSNLKQFKDLESNPTLNPNTSLPTPLPLELTYLRPPPPPHPSNTTYPLFSEPNFITITPELPPPEELLFDPTSPTLNHAALLTRLTKSLLLNFLELITVLTEAPTEHTEKIADIRKLIVNCHAVINMYRPHQARENVKEMLEGMLEEGRREIEDGERVRGEVEGFLKEIGGWKSSMREDGGEVDRNAEGRKEGKVDGTTDEKRLEEARRLWSIMDEIGNE